MDILSYPAIIRPVISIILAIISFFTSTIGGGPLIPHGKEIDISEYEITWQDEFDGDSLDFSKWDGHFFEHGQTIIRRGSYWNTDLAVVKDGKLHIETKYYPDGLNGNGKPGWYTCGIDTSRCVMQRYGYFECRCVLPKGTGLWSAFWMFSSGVGDTEHYGMNGKYGSEIDVFESPYYFSKDKFSRNSVSSNIHIDGYGEFHKSENVCKVHLPNDPYEEFNTYGVLWTPEEYIFYVNGIETGRTKFGVSQVPEWLILSVEIGGNNGVPADDWSGPSINSNEEPVTDFIVDYVRMYQKKEK